MASGLPDWLGQPRARQRPMPTTAVAARPAPQSRLRRPDDGGSFGDGSLTMHLDHDGTLTRDWRRSCRWPPLGLDRPSAAHGLRACAGRHAALWGCEAATGILLTRGLLIRGFGVRVPGGAPVIKALAWSFSPVRSLLHVHSGRLCARGVLRSRWTVSGLRGRDGRNGTACAGWLSGVDTAELLPGRPRDPEVSASGFNVAKDPAVAAAGVAATAVCLPWK